MCPRVGVGCLLRPPARPLHRQCRPGCALTSFSLLFRRQRLAQPRTGEVSVQEGGLPAWPPAAGFLSHSPLWLWMAHETEATAIWFLNVFNLFVWFITLCRPKAVLNRVCQLYFSRRRIPLALFAAGCVRLAVEPGQSLTVSQVPA